MAAELPVEEALAAQLYRASALSSDVATADLSLTRILPVSVFLDGDQGRLENLLGSLLEEVRNALATVGYEEAYVLEPSSSSLFTAVFGKSTRPKDGSEFKRDQANIASRIAHWWDSLPAETKAGLRLVLVVASVTIEVVGAGVIATALPIMIPVSALELVVRVHLVTEVAEAVHKLVEAHQEKSKPAPFRPKSGSFKL
jgi:hypothetical protein